MNRGFFGPPQSSPPPLSLIPGCNWHRNEGEREHYYNASTHCTIVHLQLLFSGTVCVVCVHFGAFRPYSIASSSSSSSSIHIMPAARLTEATRTRGRGPFSQCNVRVCVWTMVFHREQKDPEQTGGTMPPQRRPTTNSKSLSRALRTLDPHHIIIFFIVCVRVV